MADKRLNISLVNNDAVQALDQLRDQLERITNRRWSYAEIVNRCIKVGKLSPSAVIEAKLSQ